MTGGDVNAWLGWIVAGLVLLVPVSARAASARVFVRVQSVLGDEVKAEITLESTEKPAGKQVKMKGNEEAVVPLGRYLATVWSPGFRERTVLLEVAAPRTEMIVSLSVGRFTERPFSRTIEGVFLAERKEDRKDAWVRLVAAANHAETRDLRLPSKGRFAFKDVEFGPYVILVVRAGRVLGMQKVDCCLNGRAVVEVRAIEK